MTKLQLQLTILFTAVSLLSSCANPHFFPRLRPLFPGLDEAQVPVSAQSALQHAKCDFQLAKHGKSPQYAKFVHTIPHTRSKVYEGQGYCLTMVHEDSRYPLRMGPEIIVLPSITGAGAYRYDEVDEVAE